MGRFFGQKAEQTIQNVTTISYGMAVTEYEEVSGWADITDINGKSVYVSNLNAINTVRGPLRVAEMRASAESTDLKWDRSAPLSKVEIVSIDNVKELNLYG